MSKQYTIPLPQKHLGALFSFSLISYEESISRSSQSIVVSILALLFLVLL